MRILFDFIDEERVTVFGTSAAFISALRKANLAPIRTHNLGSLRAMLSTGSPLPPESFDYVCEQIRHDVHLASISGGTDIIGCFALGCPIIPVHRGELQTRSLGYAVDVFNDEGRSVLAQKGELVCTAPFPSMPIGFWNDPGDKRYLESYFSRFPGVWCHGDFVSLTENNGLVIYGRSDSVLNPGGVRIGTAEIYRQLEGIDSIEAGVVVEQKWQDDTRIVLFVKLIAGHQLDETLRAHIRDMIHRNASPRHVPKKIIQVADIPVTRSGKISEIAVKHVIHGMDVSNQQALANPESLTHFVNVEELQS
jgi:acetoacetyl-CoA synthetase